MEQNTAMQISLSKIMSGASEASQGIEKELVSEE